MNQTLPIKQVNGPFSLGVSHYDNDKDCTHIQLNGFNIKQLVNQLPRKQRGNLKLSLWKQSNTNVAKEAQFWECLGKTVKNYSFTRIKVQYFAKKLNRKAFEEGFLKRIDTDVTEVILVLGQPTAANVKLAIKSSVKGLSLFNTRRIPEDEWQVILTEVTNSTMLKYVELSNTDERRVIEILDNGDDVEVLKVSNLTETGNMVHLLTALKDVKETVRFAAEINIDTRNEDVIKFCKELNIRKTEPRFNMMIIEDAIKRNKRARLVRSKLMFIGQGRAGKTCTMKSLLNQPFDHTKSTPVADAKGQITILAKDMHVLENDWLVDEEKDHVLQNDFENKMKRMVNGSKLVRGAKKRWKKAKQFKFGKKKTTTNLMNVPETNSNTNVPYQSLVPKKRIDLPAKYGARIEHDADKDEKKIKRTITLWDFGGQRVFHTVHHMFLTDNGVYVLVFDFKEMIANKNSSLNHMRFWLDSVLLHTKHAPILIVATKVGGNRAEDFVAVNKNIKLLFKTEYKVFYQNLQQNKKHGRLYFTIENSYDNGVDIKKNQILLIRKEIEAAFDKMTQIGNESFSEDVPLSWIYFMDLIVRKYSKKVLFSDILREVESVPEFDKEEIEKMLATYHRYGTILSFRGISNSTLHDYIILSPQWLVDAIKEIIYDKDVHHLERKKQIIKFDDLHDLGMISDDLLNELWLKNEFQNEDRKFLKELFKKMSLMCEYSFMPPRNGTLKNSDWLIPSMCCRKAPKSKFLQSPNLITIQLRTERRQPEGFFERVVCRFVKESNSIEGSKEPHVSSEISVVYFRRAIFYISNSTDKRNINFHFKKSANKNQVLRFISTCELLIESMKQGNVGNVIKPKLLAITQDVEPEYALLEELRDMEDEVNLYNAHDSIPVERFGMLKPILDYGKRNQSQQVVLFNPSVPVPVRNIVKRWDVFISYEWATSANRAKWLHETLEAHNLTVWRDQHEMKTELGVGMIEAASKSIVCVVLLSNTYSRKFEIEDSAVYQEVMYKTFCGGVKYILPVVIEEEQRDHANWSSKLLLKLTADKIYVALVTEREKQNNVSDLLEKIKHLKQIYQEERAT